jgi:hypothetical protein
MMRLQTVLMVHSEKCLNNIVLMTKSVIPSGASGLVGALGAHDVGESIGFELGQGVVDDGDSGQTKRWLELLMQNSEGFSLEGLIYCR